MNETEQSSPGSRPLARYVTVLRRQWWLVAVVTLLAVGAAAIYTETQRTVYASSMKIVVGQGRALFGPDVSFAVQPFTQTMTDLLQSDVVARQTIAEDRLDITPNELLDRISVTSRPDTSVLEVTYEDYDRARATSTLQTIGTVFTRLVDSQLASRTARGGNNADGTANEPVSATVFDPAHAQPGVVAPKTARTLGISLVLGLIAGVALAFLRDALSSRVRSEREAEEAFGAPVAGQLPAGAVGTRPAEVGMLPARVGARLAESLELLTATVRYAGGSKESGVVLVTSSRPEDGKTTVVSQLAATLARGGVTVVAVEADLRRPALHRFLDVEPGRAGLTDVLAGAMRLDDVLVSAPLTAVRPALVRSGGRGSAALEPDPLAGSGGRLLLLPAGRQRDNPTQSLSLARSAELLAQLREIADFVVIDTPPMLLSGDAFPLAQLSDSVLVVCREGVTSREEARTIRDTLGTLGVRHFSVVLTESAEVERRAYGYGYGSGESA